MNFTFSLIAVPMLAIPTSHALAQSIESMRAPATCWHAAATSRVYESDDRCVRIWADSLRSSVPATVSLARNGLVATGGRAAVDALRDDFERAPTVESRFAVMTAMSTTGSRDDIVFLARQLQGPFIGIDNWPRIQLAATTLGLLRATAARDSLQAALTRNGSWGFAGRAVAAALASLDRPPCADSIVGDLDRNLVRIAMQCGPQSMTTSTRYLDSSRDSVWSFSEGTWHLGTRTVTDTGTISRVSTSTTLATDGRHANVIISTWCGRLCGEGWVFRLVLIGNVWRVVGSAMNWVS